MRFLLTLLISTLLLTANDKIALVIGNKNYSNQTGLKNPIRDAKLLRDTLEGLGFSVIEVYNANVDTISDKLAEFSSKANSADVAVVYYAGHGVGVDDKNYLIPLGTTNLSRATLPKKLISLDELKEAVSSSKGFGVIFFDACRNSFFSGKIRGLSGNRGSRALVQPQASSKNILISFSTQAGQLAKDDVDNATHSPYAIALSEKLKLKKDIRLVMGGVKERVEKLTNYEQEPISRSSLGEDFFCLTGCGYTPPPPPPKGGKKINKKLEEKLKQLKKKKAEAKKTQQLVAPLDIPKEEPQDTDVGLIASLKGVGDEGVPGGVDGGIPGGVDDGSLTGLIERVGDDNLDNVQTVVQPPKIIKRVAPVYPPLAAKIRAQGDVVLQCVTDIYGNVVSVKVLSSPHPLLTKAAVDAVRQWKFEPMIINGIPRPVRFVLRVKFRLTR